MYTSTLLASAAILAGTAYATTPGNAVVVNACSYPVYLSAVPAAGGGQQEVDTVLGHGQSWTQQFTELTNGDGWSIKMSKSSDKSNPLQYEYTYHSTDSVIWFDLSCVDGNPWDGNWEVTSSGNSACIPKQSFYRFATDDAFGMQDCPVDSDITVTLCSGEDQAESIVSAIIASSTPSAAPTTTTPTTTVVPTTTATPTTTSTSTISSTTAVAPTTTGHPLGWKSAHFYQEEAASQTTFVTATTAAVVNDGGNVVVEVVTVVETATAYETYVPGKRHVHHPDHPHFR